MRILLGVLAKQNPEQLATAMEGCELALVIGDSLTIEDPSLLTHLTDGPVLIFEPSKYKIYILQACVSGAEQGSFKWHGKHNIIIHAKQYLMQQVKI